MSTERHPHPDPSAFGLTLPPSPEWIGIARLFATGVARHFGGSEEAIEDMKIAVSEACTNAIKAHLRTNVEDAIHISADVDPDALSITIADRGGGFGDRVEPAGVVTPPGGLYEGSLGLLLIRSLFPKVQIDENADGGTTVSFAIDLDDRPASLEG